MENCISIHLTRTGSPGSPISGATPTPRLVRSSGVWGLSGIGAPRDVPGASIGMLVWMPSIIRLIGYRDIDLMTWQQMCAKLGLHANLRSITKCKRGVSHVHVNIVDIIDCWEADERPQLFKSRKELSNYVKTGMRFPLDIIRQDKVLRVFLGHID
ncbi:hypothetical protein VI817_009156 [Penicillium citrinum]|nr:hypothetical protein VI817_009156 [Penicillium citrinum]